MPRNVALVALTSIAWACADSARPLAPALEAPMASALGDEVASAAFPGNRGVSLVEAYIDGRSELALAHTIMQWTHFDGAAPGRLNGVFYPTRLGPDSWYPYWPDVPDSENRDCNGCFSDLEWLNVPIWPFQFDLGLKLRRGRGTASLRYEFNAHRISFNDNAFPGAAWYTVSIDTRFPLGVQPWPNQTPYVVSLSKQKYVSLALLSDGLAVGDPRSLTDFSLGDDRGMETGIALGAGGVPLIRIADVNNDSAEDAVLRFRVSDLVYHGDAAVGQTVLRVTARLFEGPWGGYYLRYDLPVTFVP